MLRLPSSTVWPVLVVFPLLPVSHFATPPWYEQVPARCFEMLYVPSRQSAVAPGGAAAAAAGTASARNATTVSKNRFTF